MAAVQPEASGLRALREEVGMSRRDFSIALHERGLEYTEMAIYKLEQGFSSGTSVMRAGLMADLLSERLGRSVGIEDLFPHSRQFVAVPSELTRKAEGSRSSRRSSTGSNDASPILPDEFPGQRAA